MLTIHPEYLVDENQRRKAVVLSLAEWQQVVEELEELDDIRAYDKAKSGPQESVPFEQAVREIGEGYGV
ncbi:MAG: hypothetical protein HYX92_07165 [Chloroflexi bacterium]|nr:hypothetical protein [Chloroflexota bacterium]